MKQNGNRHFFVPRSSDDAQAYFKKLGANFKKLPFLKLKFEDYENFFIQKNGLFRSSNLKKEDGIAALLIVLPIKKSDPVRLTFKIEEPSKVDRLIQALQKNVRTSKEKTFLKALERLQIHCAKLHQQWREKHYKC